MAEPALEVRTTQLETALENFMGEMARLQRAAEERNRAAEERMARFERVSEERSREAEERLARFELEMREFKVEMRQSKRDLDKKWGDLANKMGTSVEDILAPNLRRIAREHFGIEEIESFAIRCARRRSGRAFEIDTLVVGAGIVIVGEAKSTPSKEYALEFSSKLALFSEFYPEYRDRRLVGVFGSWSISDDVVGELTRLGIYAMRMGEDTMELVNAAVLEQGAA